MNPKVLFYFSVLAQEEHYTVAAARLGISQPSLSSAIHNLETELGGVKLFEKVGRNIRLTEAGKFYQEKVDAALNELHAASLSLRDGRRSAPVMIRMGFVSGTLHDLAAKKIAEYRAGNDRIRFRLVESSAEDLMDLVRQEKLDMAIVDAVGRDRSLNFRKLCGRSLCAALPEAHPLAASPMITPENLENENRIALNDSISASFRSWTPGASSGKNVVCTVNTVHSALEMVAAGAGLALIPISCAADHPGVRYVPLEQGSQMLYMCILHDKWLEPPIWDFVELLVQSMRSAAKDAE